MNIFFFISSVINATGDPLTYSYIRSIYSTEERFQQTLKTIESIRTYVPSAKIIMIETSDLSEEQTAILKSKVEYFINTNNDSTLRAVCLHSPKKGYGEVLQSRVALSFLLQNNIEFDLFFKISGRYWLTNDFNINEYSISEYTYKDPIFEDAIHILTVLYSVPKSLKHHYLFMLNKIAEIYEEYDDIVLERVLPFICLPRKLISKVGVEGYLAPNGDHLIA